MCQIREELLVEINKNCFPSNAWYSCGFPQGPGKGSCAQSYHQKFLSPSGKYEFIPHSAGDANNMVRGSDRTKHAHTSVCCGLWLDVHQLLVNIWRKEWLKQDISSGMPVGGPARVSLHPGMGPMQNSLGESRLQENWRETGLRDQDRNLQCCCPYWLDCMDKKFALTNNCIKAFFSLSSFNPIVFLSVMVWPQMATQLDTSTCSALPHPRWNREENHRRKNKTQGLR